MENILTDSEIAKVFAMYLGCEIEPLQRSAGGYSMSQKELTIDNINLVLSHSLKLKLTPLIKITDEHAIEVAELINEEKYITGETFKVIKEDEKISIFSSEVIHESIKPFGYRYETKFYTDGYATPIKPYSLIRQMPFESYQYLISKGYSVPLFLEVNHWANGKTAIELNIAIEMPTNN